MNDRSWQHPGKAVMANWCRLLFRFAYRSVCRRFRGDSPVEDWYQLGGKYHQQTFPHECRLSSLPEDWQRELAALWRLESDVNNGAYLQFLGNWGRESYVYASQALKNIGARKMAKIVDQCQSLVDEHVDCQGKSFVDLQEQLPQEILERVYDLSYEFMDYPDDLPTLGMRYYGSGPAVMD